MNGSWAVIIVGKRWKPEEWGGGKDPIKSQRRRRKNRNFRQKWKPEELKTLAKVGSWKGINGDWAVRKFRRKQKLKGDWA